MLPPYPHPVLQAGPNPLSEVQLLLLQHPSQPGGEPRWYMRERQAESVLGMGANVDVKKSWSASEYIEAGTAIARSAHQELHAGQKGRSGAQEAVVVVGIGWLLWMGACTACPGLWCVLLMRAGSPLPGCSCTCLVKPPSCAAPAGPPGNLMLVEAVMARLLLGPAPGRTGAMKDLQKERQLDLIYEEASVVRRCCCAAPVAALEGGPGAVSCLYLAEACGTGSASTRTAAARRHLPLGTTTSQVKGQTERALAFVLPVLAATAEAGAPPNLLGLAVAPAVEVRTGRAGQPWLQRVQCGRGLCVHALRAHSLPAL